MRPHYLEIRRLVLESLLLRAESTDDPCARRDLMDAYDLIARGEVVVRNRMPRSQVAAYLREDIR